MKRKYDCASAGQRTEARGNTKTADTPNRTAFARRVATGHCCLSQRGTDRRPNPIGRDGLLLRSEQQPNARRTVDRASLPTPTLYLSERGLLLGKIRGDWTTLRCPVHKAGAEAHPSLRISLADGHFRCMTCGVRGGDLIALHRLLTGTGFVQAVRELGGRFHE